MKILLLIASVAASPMLAQDFDVTLGGRSLGSLTLATDGAGTTLSTRLDNTPLGVFNGTFQATSTRNDDQTEYRSASASSRKQRQIDIGINQGRVVSTRIEPRSEETSLSTPAKVPDGVIDPVQAFALIAGSTTCPAALRFYDGRRVIEITPLGQTETGAETLCQMSYQVTGGPGHLSPLRFKSVAMTLQYRDRRLHRIEMKAGLFTVAVQR